MSIPLPGGDPAGYPSGGIHVLSGDGVHKWFSGDVYSVKLTGEQTNGSIGVVHASVPPGGGPVPHTHADADETFYVLSGELEFLDGETTFVARTGDIVHIPRTIRHRFLNNGLHTAQLLFIYTGGGSEGLFVEGGDEPEPGVQVENWGPERFADPRIQELFVKYGVEALP
ncbi:cupin domain-containing protein [Kribbella sandramycini]|uniref:Cupin domain-containing protein n=1 Tax=Kribbella sandramycini TaxID=60450 RepID=A0A7Y4NZ68_9ACTN|nr:cupin domain-containing protein [Kribbella sandramycini]MBB6567724.1 quercetin dioxygenase-like cupin family protein [Kribbella sandramycini]NOL39679.1 cupin domain-containing protein [Kribbella sandramycini]